MNDWLKKIKPYLPYIIALIAGGLLPLGLAPFYMGVATIVSVSLLVACIAKAKWPQAVAIGLCFGIGLFGIGASWIYASIHDYGYAAPWLASLITGLFIFILALFPAAQLGILVRYFPNNSPMRTCLVFPAWWALFEIFRGWFLTGFPWLYVGYSQMDNHLSAAYAPIGGVFLVSYFTVLISCALYALVDYHYAQKTKPKLRNLLYIILIGTWVLAYGIQQYIFFTFPTGKMLTVALIQGNIPQLLRWDPEAVSNIIRSYRESTMAITDADLIVWPESAVPLPLPLSTPLFTNLNGILKARHVGLIAGVPSEVRNGEHYYNSLVGVGEATGIYHKHHLVPFGEYVPLEKQLRGLIAFFDLPMSAFIGASAEQGPLEMGIFRFAPAICYEIAYPFYVQSLSQNANVILTVSNDTWFGKTIGPAQHLQIAQFRALENGMPVIRATNSGFTAIMDYQGNVTAIAPQFEATVLKGAVEIRDGQTPWTRYGRWPILIFLGGIMGIALLLRLKRKI